MFTRFFAVSMVLSLAGICFSAGATAATLEGYRCDFSADLIEGGNYTLRFPTYCVDAGHPDLSVEDIEIASAATGEKVILRSLHLSTQALVEAEAGSQYRAHYVLEAYNASQHLDYGIETWGNTAGTRSEGGTQSSDWYAFHVKAHCLSVERCE